MRLTQAVEKWRVYFEGEVVALKKIGLVTVIIVLLGLSWLAFDDITTGSEPNYIGEWVMIGSTVVVLGELLMKLVKRRL